jgi:hypothetical protein
MEVAYYSDTSVDSQRTTRLYIPEDKTIQRIIFRFCVELWKPCTESH